MTSNYDKWLEQPYQERYAEEDRLQNLFETWWDELSDETKDILETFECRTKFDIYESWVTAFSEDIINDVVDYDDLDPEDKH
jgi:hypothetical protein